MAAQMVLMGPVLWYAAGLGIEAVSVALVVMGLPLLVLRLVVVGRFLSIGVKEIIKALGPAASATMVMFAGTWAVRWGLADLGLTVRLVISVGSGALLYAGALWVFYPALVGQALSAAGVGRKVGAP